MLSIWRSPRYESNTIEAHQTGLRSDPQISICGLCNSIWRSAKDSVLNPPGGVSILGDAVARIYGPDRPCCEQEQEAKRKESLNTQLPCLQREGCTHFFKWSRVHVPPA